MTSAVEEPADTPAEDDPAVTLLRRERDDKTDFDDEGVDDEHGGPQVAIQPRS